MSLSHCAVPEDESQRLAWMKSTGIDRIRAGDDLAALVRLAACIADVPVAYVSVANEHSQRIVAQTGIDEPGDLPRDVSVCNEALLNGHQIVVANTASHERFSDHPWVTGQLGIRSFVASLVQPDAGWTCGTLCVADTVSRQFPPDVVEQLEKLADVAAFLIRISARQETESSAGIADEFPLPLFSMRHMRETVSAWLSDQTTHATLVLIDADQFKLINDRFGHGFGDEYLEAIERMLRLCMPKSALMASAGGDEFVAFVPDLTEAELERTLLALRTMLRATAADFDKPELGKLSIGTCSTRLLENRDFEALYQAADVALAASKDKGLNRTTSFSAAIDDTYNIGKLQARFLDALDGDRVIPYFQPVLDLATGTVSSFEALVRWNDPDRGLLTPAAFTKMLTDRSAGPLLTQKMIDGALRAHELWRGNGMPAVRLAINLTERDLADPGFVSNLDWKISESGFQWHDFTFEVTETVMLGNVEDRIFKSMSALRARGAKIALDDFGTGYAGLVHLRDWPITSLKIDQKFVMDLANSKKDHIIVQMILDLADRLGLQVCAEGIEDADAAAILSGFGCDYGQGYHFSPPLEINAAMAFLEENLLRKGQPHVAAQ